MAASAEDLALFGGDEPTAKPASVPGGATPDDIALFSGSEPPKPSLWERAKASASKFGGSIVDDVKGFGSGAVDAAKELVDHPIDAAKDTLTGVGRGFAGIYSALNGAGNQLGDIALGAGKRIAAHPLGSVGDTFQDTLADPRFRTEAMRGVNDNIPLANRAVEAIGGPPAYSQDDEKAFPNARPLGGLAGMALPVGKAIGATADKVAGALSNVGPGAKLTAAARARVIKQGVSDLVGTKETGRAVDTDVKKMGRAIEPIRDELATPEGLALADTARTDPDAAMKMTDYKLREITKERLPDYRTVDAATGRGGVRAGDYVKHLEDSADALEATGEGEDAAIATEVRKRVNLLKRAKNWGGGASAPIDRNAAFNADYTVGQYLDLMDKAGHGEQAMADVEAARKPGAWNPDAIVPTVNLRNVVTDMQSTAYNNLGGINGTNAFKKAQKVARVGEEFLDQHLDAAKKADPAAADAVDRILAMNRRVNAYATIRNALDSRVGKVDTAEMKMSPATKLEMGLSAGLAAAGSPGAAAAGFAATKILPKAISAADRGITRAIANRGAIEGRLLPAADPTIGLQSLPVKTRVVNAAVGATTNPAGVARLVQAARAGATRADLQAQAKKDGIPTEIASNIAAQNGL